MLGDALCASGERIESRGRSTDDAVDDAYYRHPKQEGGWSTISLLRFEQAIEKQHEEKNPPFVVSSQRCQLPPIPFSSATVVAVSMEMCVQNLYPWRSPELPGNSRKALVELRATKERLRCESFPIPRCLLPDARLTPSSDTVPFPHESRTGAMYPGLQVQENGETNFPKKIPRSSVATNFDYKNLTLGRGTFAFDARALSGFNVKSLRATTSELAEASHDAVTRAE
ncbi:hypothetical protein G5I_06408 [Acromyrmex echinatior]|uniref:Uncharacterized protein n=1 Tax=Acromyrmex echinatior TaxID=103372 RepID=F4WKY7_ACREC|nr:hypothetical protein G5I_06408 [Acromyrmex echinatior]